MTASDAGHNLTFTNSASAIAQAGSLFSLAGTASGSNSVFQVNGGGIRAGTMNIRALSASNAGQIQSLGAATFALSGAFSNSNPQVSDRKDGGEGKRGAVLVDLGGRRTLTKKKKTKKT